MIGRRKDPKKVTEPYDERVYHRGPQGVSRVKLGLILVALLAVGSYLAVTKELPFKHEYEVKAVFANAANIRKGSPVRIAGVNVGEVKGISGDGNNGEVTFTVKDEGRPLRTDSTVKIRPRIFLEGNFFLDVKPGTPNTAEIPDGGTIPVTHTSTAVQLDEILTSLQAPSRANLQQLLEGYGTGLTHKPTAAEDVGQDPSVKGKTAAAALNGAFRYGGDAGKGTAIVNEALLGTEPHDLSGLIAAVDRTSGALNSHEADLQGLITNFNTTAGAFAAESDNLGRAVKQLGPTLKEAQPALAKLNATFPPLRRFSLDIRPGVAELPATFEAAYPWIAQARPLFGNNELGGIAKQLKLAAPGLAAVTHSSLSLFPQLEQTSRCFSDVLIPTGDVTLNDPVTPTGQPNYREFFYGTVGLAGESQGFDGNGPFVRFQSGGGPTIASAPNPNGGFDNDRLYGRTIAPPIGTQPILGGKPAYRTDVPCASNDIPDLNGPLAGPGAASPSP